MHTEALHAFALQLNGAEASQPFGPEHLVYKVGGKMFLLLSLDSVPLQFNVKCDPDKALELREQYNCVQPGYHMNKKHWNTIIADGSASNKLLMQWIQDSYELVYQSLSKTCKAQLAASPSSKASSKT